MAREVTIDFNFDLQDSYGRFIRKLRRILRDHEDPMDVWDENTHVLAKQTYGKAPGRWIHINLKGYGNMRTTLAVRDDNLYLLGFRNREERWYQFGFKDQNKRMVHRDALFLECDVRYKAMVDSYSDLVSLGLGERFVREAVTRLSGYAEGPGVKADREIRRYLAGLIVIICEAARMDKPFQTLLPGWHNQHGSMIHGCEVDYILNWGDMSEGLLRWKELRYKEDYEFPDHLNRIGVPTPWRAHQIVRLLLYRKIDEEPTWVRRFQRVVAGGHGRSEGSLPQTKRARLQQQSGQGHGQLQQQPQQQKEEGHRRGRSDPKQQETAVPPGPAEDYEVRGRPLVEVFAVRARYNFVGTVAIFDGRRGQIICKNDSIQDSSPPDDGELRELLMTGPYAAVTAHGSFTVEVEIKEGDYTDAGELNWDCYNNTHDGSKKYDKPITSTIKTNRGHEVEVTYAVLSDAVEANLEVSLRLPGLTARACVYGEITARIQAIDGPELPRIVLLDPKLERVALKGGCRSLPLARSVLAMPFDRSLLINANLYNERPQEGVSPFFQCEDLKLTLGCQPTSVLKAVDGAEVEVKISSPDIYLRERTTPTARPPLSHYACSSS